MRREMESNVLRKENPYWEFTINVQVGVNHKPRKQMCLA